METTGYIAFASPPLAPIHGFTVRFQRIVGHERGGLGRPVSFLAVAFGVPPVQQFASTPGQALPHLGRGREAAQHPTAPTCAEHRPAHASTHHASAATRRLDTRTQCCRHGLRPLARPTSHVRLVARATRHTTARREGTDGAQLNQADRTLRASRTEPGASGNHAARIAACRRRTTMT